jgi:hypothetical protein
MAARGECRYLSFLLRLWRINQNGCEIWRASLENPRTGERRGFVSLEALIMFLLQKTQDGEEDKQNNQISDEPDGS